MLELIRDFIVFGDKGRGPFKIIAGYHQFHGVPQGAADRPWQPRAPDGDRKIGVIWHTQGSGKSLLDGLLSPARSSSTRRWQNPTLVVLTDRNDLDDQLFGTFSMCKDLLRQTPQQAERPRGAAQRCSTGRPAA